MVVLYLQSLLKLLVLLEDLVLYLQGLLKLLVLLEVDGNRTNCENLQGLFWLALFFGLLGLLEHCQALTIEFRK